MPYGHFITATVMTLGVCQGRLSVASFSILTSASRGPSAIAEPLVKIGQTVVVIWHFFNFFKMAAIRHLGFIVC